jgi:Restriction endonuclease S subunits
MKASDLGRHDTSSDDKSNYKRVEINDIAYNSMRMWQGASGHSPYSGILSPAYTVITPQEGIFSPFFACLFKMPNMIHKFQINSQGLTSDTWNLKYPALSSITARVPSYAEQEKISVLFTRMDALITLHQRAAEILKNSKKALLEMMFLKEDN